MADSARVRRLADRIQEVAARMLDTRIKDPRLGFVTVTDVRVTGDLQHADVFYTVYGDDEARAGSAAALASATGLIRSEVGKATGLRPTPTLAFHLDAVPETAKHLEDALAAAARKDAEVAALARRVAEAMAQPRAVIMDERFRAERGVREICRGRLRWVGDGWNLRGRRRRIGQHFECFV